MIFFENDQTSVINDKQFVVILDLVLVIASQKNARWYFSTVIINNDNNKEQLYG